MSNPLQVGQIRLRARVTGLVQGVGFRPFVWREATSRGLSGWVGNDATGVVLEVQGDAGDVTELLAALRLPPALGRVDSIDYQACDLDGTSGFSVRKSDPSGPRVALVSPDAATCLDCLCELADPADRRFGYPFTNCTNCGPRYTIVRQVPYDRARTTMAEFSLCSACAAEYDDPGDRRFHAEPLCCANCGPSLRLTPSAPGEPMVESIALLQRGGVLAVKGLGGFHLAVDAGNEPAVAVLRARKHREQRPFAVMVLDLSAARELGEVNESEAALLSSAARPIVLLRRRTSSLAPSVAPGSPNVGVMLAYTPLHVLLLTGFGGPLVMTSGNLSDEPIAFQDEDARVRLTGLADAVLGHDREIRTRVDDSVVKVVHGRVVPIRRSRGYVPTPIVLTAASPRSVLAVGAALKNTFCLSRDKEAFVSHHIGDLEEYSTFASYLDGIAHLSDLLAVEPAVLAHDLHPDYPSTRYAMERDDVQLIGVQHHHAHIASCLADNGLEGPVIGVAFDGLGLGTDGTAWGGEFLIAELRGFTRAGHLAVVPMPGGDAATRQPWRMAAAHLDAAYHGDLPRGLAVAERQGRSWEKVLSASRALINAPLTSSAGRLFDAVAALLGVRDVISYEGQAAIELEQLADVGERGSYPLPIGDQAVAVLDPAPMLRSLVDDLALGTDPKVLAARFHNTLAGSVLQMCLRLREQHGLGQVALSGGVFQNGLLLSRCLDALEGAKFEVLTHRRVPANDGGISLGQVAVAGARLTQQ